MRGEQHLTKPAQYGLVYEKGRSWANVLLVMKAMPNGLDLSRYGFSVSKRVGGAVVRNRVRRRLREILRQAPLRRGWDIVFIVRQPAAGADYHRLDQAARDLMRRAKLLEGNREEISLKTD